MKTKRFFADGKTRFLSLLTVLTLLFTLGSGNAWGTYTITFNGSSSESTPITTSTTAASITGSSSYVTENVVTATKVYGATSDGIKLGASSNSGTIKISLSASGQVTPTSIVVNCKLYNSSKSATLKVNGSATQSVPSSSGDLTFSITSPITYIELVSSKYIWVKSVTVNTAAATYNVYLMSGCDGGSYSSNKGTSGSGTGAYSSCTKYSGISANTSVTITATPTSGYQFDGWTDGGYSIILDDESNEITPSSTTSTTATFTMPSSDVVIWDCNFSETCNNAVTIQAANSGTGTNCTFTVSPNGAQASCSGVSTTVTITPNTGYGNPSVTQSGASAAPTISGSGNSWTVTYAANTTGTSTINVSCSAMDYIILFDEEGATTSGDAGIEVTYNSNTNLTSAINTPSKTGWTFGGYYTAKQGGGTQIIDASGNVLASKTGYTDASRNWIHADDVTLYAKWTCEVTWSVNGATNVYSSQTVTYNSSGSKVASVPTPDPASYCGDVFAGWSLKNAGTENKTTSYYDDLFTDVAGSPNLNSITTAVTFYAVFADEDND